MFRTDIENEEPNVVLFGQYFCFAYYVVCIVGNKTMCILCTQYANANMTILANLLHLHRN